MKFKTWKPIKDLINETEIGKTITRKQIIFKVYGKTKPCEKWGLPSDRYRRALAILGFLEIVDRGVYKVLAHIKPELTSHKLWKCAYSNDYLQWFHNFKEDE